MSRYRKLIVGLIGFAVTVLTSILAVDSTLIPVEALPWVNVFIMVASAYGIWAVRNDPAPDVDIPAR